MINLGRARKTAAILANVSLFLNSFLPFVLTIQPVYAQSSEEVAPTEVVQNSPTPETTPTTIVETTPTLETTITPETTSTPEVTITPEPTPTPERTLITNPINSEVGTLIPSINTTVTSTPTIEITPTITPAPSSWTFEKVELNKEYVAPQNNEVKLTFTKLPENSGNIKIEEITLTPEQIQQTGSLSDKAYDITSDMADGTFAYNLSLPIPESSKGKAVDVKFSEDISKIDSAQKVDNSITKTDTIVSVKNLDHFTVFIIAGQSIQTPDCNNSSFDTFNFASVNGQSGWSSLGNYDQAIVPNTYGFSSFGCKTLRLSNAITSGSFGDQTFSFSTTNEAGETSATNGGKSIGIRQNHFEAQFDFASTQSTQQPGLAISVSPDRGDGSRMSYLRFVDNTDGIDVFFDDVSGITSPVNFNEVIVAHNLSRTTTHTAKFVIDFVNGSSNDVVKIYIDGSLVKTGTTWENYYRFDTEASTEQITRTTNDLIFRAGGDSVPSTSQKGFLFDNINLSSTTILPDTTAPTATVITPVKDSTKTIVYTFSEPVQLIKQDTREITSLNKDLLGIYEFNTSTGDYGPNKVVGTNITAATLNNNVLTITYTGSLEINKNYVVDTWGYDITDLAGNKIEKNDPKQLFRIADENILSAPTNLTPTDNSYTNNPAFSDTWSPVIGAAKYEYRTSNTLLNNGDIGSIIYSDNSTFSNYSITPTLITRHNNGTPQGTYYWQVRAINADGTPGTWSGINKVTVDTNPPSIPTLSTPINNGYENTNDFYFTWIASNDISPLTYEFQSSGSNVIDKNNSLIGAWNSIKNGNSEQNNLTSPRIHSTGAPQGTYYWQVRAIDAAGNQSAWSSAWKMTIDSINPVMAITNPTTNQIIKGRSILINGTATDSDFNYYYCYVSNTNGHEYGIRDGSCNTTWHAVVTNGLLGTVTLPNDLSDGNYVVHLIGKDKTGNTTEVTQPFVLDNTRPSLSFITPTDFSTPFKTGPVVSVYGSDATGLSALNIHVYNNSNVLQSTSCTATSAELISGNLSCNLSGLSDGIYYIKAGENDKAGNNQTITSVNFTIDTVAPVGGLLTMKTKLHPNGLTVLTPDTNGVYTITQPLSITGVDVFNSLNIVVTDTDLNITSVPVYVDGIKNGEMVYSGSDNIWNYDHQTSVVDFQTGTHNLTAVFSDNAGNTKTLTARFTTDNTAPIATVSYNITNPTNKSVIATLIDQSEPITITSVGGLTHEFTANGSFTFEFVDTAGNTGSTIATVNNIDKTAPIVKITAPAFSITNNNVEIKGTMTDLNPDHYYLVILNSKGQVVAGPGTITSKSSFEDKSLFNWDISSVLDGVYTIDLEARDAADNKDFGSVATKNITIDKTSPIITFTVNPIGLTKENTQTFTVSTSEPVQSCILTGLPVDHQMSKNEDGTYSVNVENIADGSINYSATCTDLAGNPGNSEIKSFTVDTQKPQLYNKTEFGNTWYNSNQASTFNFTDENGIASGNNPTCVISTEGSLQTCSTDLNVCDNAGNCNTETIVSNGSNIDKTKPIISVSVNPTNPDASNGWYKTQPEISATTTDNNSSVFQYQWDSKDGSWTNYTSALKPLTEGVHTLYLQAKDLAGNNVETSQEVKWDQTDPVGPQNITADPNPTSGSTSKIKWDFAQDNIGIDRYEIQWNLNDTNNPLSYSKTVGSGDSSVDIDQLVEGRWTVKVIAFDQSGQSKDNSIDLNVDQSGPVAPTLKITSTGAGTATLSWNAVSDAQNYIIWYGTTPGQHLYGAKVGNVTSYTVQGLSAGNYYFEIKSVDAAQNQSGYSNEVNTGAITGAPNTVPGQPATGFTGEVKGVSTEVTPTVTENQKVLGASTQKGFNWWWLLLILFVIPLYAGSKRVFKKKRRNH
jgi:hypothetical protein